VFFIPETNLLAAGAWIFIWSSVVSAIASTVTYMALSRRLGAVSVVHVPSMSTTDVILDSAQASNDSLHQELLVDCDSDHDTSQILYQRIMLKSFMLCSACYTVGAIIFVVGSVFFLPLHPSRDGTSEEFVFAGTWLFVCGSVFFLFGGVLALVVIKETEKTSAPIVCPAPASWWLLPTLSEQEVLVNASWLYVHGAILFLIGTGVIYPREWLHDGAAAAKTIYAVGIALFVVGSVGFLLGAALDCVYTQRRLLRRRAADIDDALPPWQ
jgi:hypothetical protein